jgi:hypothetical protein
MLHFHNKICRTIMICRYFLWNTQISSTLPDVASLESSRELPRRYLTLTYCPRTLADTPNTAGTFQPFALFIIAFSRFTEWSPVRTDSYFCSFVLWTHILHRNIIMLVKEWNIGLMAIEFASVLNLDLFQTRFHSAIETIVMALLWSNIIYTKENRYLLFDIFSSVTITILCLAVFYKQRKLCQ